MRCISPGHLVESPAKNPSSQGDVRRQSQADTCGWFWPKFIATTVTAPNATGAPAWAWRHSARWFWIGACWLLVKFTELESGSLHCTSQRVKPNTYSTVGLITTEKPKPHSRDRDLAKASVPELRKIPRTPLRGYPFKSAVCLRKVGVLARVTSELIAMWLESFRERFPHSPIC